MRAIKQPGAKLTFRYEFSDELGTATLASVSGVPVSVPKGSGANLVQSGAASIDGTGVLVTWQGGVDGETYATTVKVLDNAGDVHERDGEIYVRELSFVVPDASSRYLTADEYVARYGQAETIRLTDEDKANVVDKVRLESSIVDSTEVADAYIGTRYSTPLVDVPRIVKSIVAALTREALHKSRPTPEVTDAAERARSQLRDIAAGRMILPVDQGQEEPVLGGNEFSLSSDDSARDEAFRSNVSGYSLDSGYSVANWRRL